ncbi:MAG: ABC transporter ATP-binding protein [Nitrospirae bacterium]|nr:ABC transporter ATP-binding protein [Nitrospirota bacterium]
MEIARRCQLINRKAVLTVVVFYALISVNAFFDGISMILIVELIAGRLDFNSKIPLVQHIKNLLTILPIKSNVNTIYFVIIGIFLLRLLLVFCVTLLNGYVEANLRRRLQEKGFLHMLNGSWEFLRSIRVGEYIGASTEESTFVARYYMGIIRLGYTIVAILVLVAISFTVSFDVTLLFIIIGVPSLFILRYLFVIRAKIAEKVVSARQAFYAYVTERLNSMFQVKLENDNNRHLSIASSLQHEMTFQEVKSSFILSCVLAVNLLLPALALLTFNLWASWNNYSLKDITHLVASVSLIGARIINQVNQVTSNIGDLVCHGGSIVPVYKLFTIPNESIKNNINERIVGVELNSLSYTYGDNACFHSVNCTAYINKPLIIIGASGSGKTTLANLISGLYNPGIGEIFYVGDSGNIYSASKFKPTVGYVTQDILLFYGTIRDNMTTYSTKVDDESIWQSLSKTGAEEFVKKLGGLTAHIDEAGRSLSGGEKRRLGIARALLRNPDILILDEVTAGLDPLRKKEIISTISELSKSIVTVIITHDDISLPNSHIYAFKNSTVSEEMNYVQATEVHNT